MTSFFTTACELNMSGFNQVMGESTLFQRGVSKEFFNEMF
jgi:hypothetical protein